MALTLNNTQANSYLILTRLITEWINGLLFKLIWLRLPDYLLSCLQYCVEGLTCIVHLTYSTSTPKLTPSCITQGTVLSTTLFSLRLFDIFSSTNYSFDPSPVWISNYLKPSYPKEEYTSHWYLSHFPLARHSLTLNPSESPSNSQIFCSLPRHPKSPDPPNR